jgi:hypothetical protein
VRRLFLPPEPKTVNFRCVGTNVQSAERIGSTRCLTLRTLRQTPTIEDVLVVARKHRYSDCGLRLSNSDFRSARCTALWVRLLCFSHANIEHTNVLPSLEAPARFHAAVQGLIGCPGHAPSVGRGRIDAVCDNVSHLVTLFEPVASVRL